MKNEIARGIAADVTGQHQQQMLLGAQQDCQQQCNFPVYLARPQYRRIGSHKEFRRQPRTAKRLMRRLIRKNGGSNVHASQTQSMWERYIRDLGHTIVDSGWRWTLIALSTSFVLSWSAFALAWMLIAHVNGDVDAASPASRPCLEGIASFAGYLMFSVETQQTIGYGSRYITEHCPEATFLMCLQIILGCAICGAMVSIVNAKMVRPLQMSARNLFSKRAVICLRDGTLCLIFRVRDLHARYAIGTAVNAYLVQSRPEEPFLKSLMLEPCGLFLWPLDVVHRVTPTSPFYDLSAKELITKRFEIIATMQGTSASTGQCSKTRTSYLSTEILWGCTFKSCISYDNEHGSYVVNNSEFNSTQEVLTPLCSAQRLDEVLQDIADWRDADVAFNYDRETRISNQPPCDDDDASDYDNVDKEHAIACGFDVEEMITSLHHAVDLQSTNG